ncbi:lipopolysaccharide biosynthesis protein [Gimesia aquarii]|uniref:Uncharacterized protein n=1 Tax=Gimesia aquarii TaxID=2527964 RepID=A0A517WX48_9PLAN|nr:polysaccharide biosynthesis C-terminal domain-containing protein [Gimesia aquarii]QDU09847.1 hypothetical protein V202x_32440 [Gimesia aquarii]
MKIQPLKSVGLFGISQLFALVAGFFLQSLVARYLQPAEYGSFVVVSTILLSLSMALVSAIPKALARFVSVDRNQLHNMWISLWTVQLPACIAIALLFGCLAPYISLLLRDFALRPLLLLITVELVVKAGVLEPSWLLLNGAGYHRIQAILIATHGGFRITCVWVLLLGGTGLIRCFIGLAVAAILSATLSGVIVSRLARKNAKSPNNMNRDLLPEFINWLRLAPFAEVITSLLAPLNLWILKSFSTDDISIGLFAACFTLAHAIIPLGLAIPRGTFSTFSNLIANNNAEDAAVLLRQILSGIFILGGLGITAAFCLGDTMITLLFGADFRGSGYILGGLTIGMLGITIIWVLGDVFNASNLLRHRFYSMIVIGCLGLLFALTLIPNYGIDGVIWSMIITGISGCMILFYVLNIRLNSFFPIMSLIRSIFASLLTLWVGAVFIEIEDIKTVIIAGVLTVAIYLLSLKILGELKFHLR